MIWLHSLAFFALLAIALNGDSILGAMLLLLRRIGTEGCKGQCQATCGCQNVMYSKSLLECQLTLRGDNSGHDSSDYKVNYCKGCDANTHIIVLLERRCNIGMVKLTNRKGEELFVYIVFTGCENIPHVNNTERYVRIVGAEITAEYTCLSPFSLVGQNKARKCDEKRKWSDTVVQCKEPSSFMKNIHPGINSLPRAFSVGSRIVVHVEPIHPTKWSISLYKEKDIIVFMEWRYTKKTLKNTKYQIFLVDGKGRQKYSEEIPFNIKQPLTIQFERNKTDYVITVANKQHLLPDRLQDFSADGIRVAGIPVKGIQVV